MVYLDAVQLDQLVLGPDAISTELVSLSAMGIGNNTMRRPVCRASTYRVYEPLPHGRALTHARGHKLHLRRWRAVSAENGQESQEATAPIAAIDRVLCSRAGTAQRRRRQRLHFDGAQTTDGGNPAAIRAAADLKSRGITLFTRFGSIQQSTLNAMAMLLRVEHAFR